MQSVFLHGENLQAGCSYIHLSLNWHFGQNLHFKPEAPALPLAVGVGNLLVLIMLRKSGKFDFSNATGAGGAENI